MNKKSALTIDEVKHVAKLANLTLSDEEVTKYQQQLSSVIDLVSKLQEIDTSNTKETSQVTGQENVFREDVIEPDRTFSQPQALSNSKKTHNGFFVVPKILDQ